MFDHLMRVLARAICKISIFWESTEQYGIYDNSPSPPPPPL